MFLPCKFINDSKCAYGAESRGQMYCGLAKGENKISAMIKCPLDTSVDKKQGKQKGKQQNAKKG